jgi:integrase
MRYTYLALAEEGLVHVVVTGVRRGELCGLQLRDVDLDRGLVHVAFNYVVRAGQRIRKDTKTHQDRWLAIDPVNLCPDRELPS